MKLECKNCKYFWETRNTSRDGDSIDTYYRCDPHRSMVRSIWGIEHYNKYELFSCGETNKFNDCPFYERKLLYFWIPKDPEAQFRKALNKHMTQNKIYDSINRTTLDDDKILSLMGVIRSKYWNDEIDERINKKLEELKEVKKAVDEYNEKEKDTITKV